MDNEPTGERPPRKISRRNFLISSATAAVAATLLKKEADRLHEERFGSQLEDDKAQEILGYNPKEHNFKALMQAESKNGKYIVHIGQSHSFDDLGITLINNSTDNLDIQKINERSKDVSFVQQNIRSLLSAEKIDTVYMEGVTKETLEELSSIVRIKQDFFDPITPGPNQWEKLLIQYDEHRNRLTKDKSTHLAPALDYSLHLTRERLSGEYSGPEGDRGQFKDDVFSINDGTYLGAAVQMFIEGEIKIAPAEIIEVNREGIEAVAAIEANREKSNAETFKKMYSDRERTTIELIAIGERMEESDDKFVYLIYGSDHNFSKAVEDNQEGYGLIKLEPIIP